MKLPSIYIKFLKLSELDHQEYKLGIGWWVVATSSRREKKDRCGIDFLHPWGRIDLLFTTNKVRYERDIEQEYRGWRIL